MTKGSEIVAFFMLLGNASSMAKPDSSIRRGESSTRALASDEPIVPTLGDWESIPDFPPDDSYKPIGEPAATKVGDELIITGGFELGWRSGAEETYSLDLKAHYEGEDNVDWVRLDDNPIKPFVSHSGHAVKGNLMYHCGGYLGHDPGRHIADCYVFNKDAEPGTQWTPIAPLPDGRGGGSMVYVEEMDSLLFSLGAKRFYDSNDTFTFDTFTGTIDYDDTWMLDLSDENADWVSMAPIPYKANHVSALVAKDCYGNPHYFFLSGQLEEREWDSNLDDVYEYFPETDKWEQRAPIPVPTGHVTSSSIAYGCGIVMVGGSVDGKSHQLTRKIKTDEIYYYDIPTDTWTYIGAYPQKAKTPACAIYADKMYCASGYLREAYRIDISYPLDLPLIAATPTEQPSDVPSSVPTPAPMWENVVVKTTAKKDSDFCPEGLMRVLLEVDGVPLKGVPVTLKNEELGIDMEGMTNKHGRAKFQVTVTDTSVSGKVTVMGCAYDENGTEYCDPKKIEVSCSS